MSDSTGTVIYRDADYAHGIRRVIALGIDLFVTVSIFAMVLSAAKYKWVPREHWDDPDPAKMQRLFREDLGPIRYNGTIATGILLMVAYQVLPRRLRGGTLGYRIARIRLVGHDGNPPTWRQVAIRCLLTIAGIFTFGAVFIPAFLRKKRQALHDQLAATWMVRARAVPMGPGQRIYKTRLFGTFPVTMTDIEPADEASAPMANGDAADHENVAVSESSAGAGEETSPRAGIDATE